MYFGRMHTIIWVFFPPQIIITIIIIKHWVQLRCHYCTLLAV